MSEGESQNTEILLPEARVAVFSSDDETLGSADSLAQDWRFARVGVNTVQGGVSAAIEHYKDTTSPDLLIIQTDEIDDDFITKLGDLSQYCDEGTAAIIVGPVNDVYLYRQLIEMGVSDYLVRPIKPEILSDVIAKALIARIGVSDSRLIAFIGAKGGVGTSSLAGCAAWIAAEKMNKKTMLMDVAGGWSSLGVAMGVDPSATLFEVSRAVENNNTDALERTLHHAHDKLTLLASGADGMLDMSITAPQCEGVIDAFMARYPTVIVDLSHAAPSVRRAVIARAHKVAVVSTPTVTSLRFCRSLLQEISDVRGGRSDEIALVINQQGASKAHEVGQADIEEALEYKPETIIPFLPTVFLKNEGDIKKVVDDSAFSSSITVFKKILGVSGEHDVSQNDGEEASKSGLMGKIMSGLSTK